MDLLKVLGVSLAIGLGSSSINAQQLQQETPRKVNIEQSTYATHRDSIKTYLGENFIGKEAWEKNIEGIVIQETPLPEIITPSFLSKREPLHENKTIGNNYMLIFIPSEINGKPLSINEFKKIANDTCKKQNKKPVVYGYENGTWYSSEEFANQTSQSGEWHLVRKEIAPKTTSKNFENQKKRIAPKQEIKVAGARTLTIATGMYYLNSGERIYKYPHTARTNDTTSGGYRVAMGLSDASGTNLLVSIHDLRAPNVGLAVEWKLKNR